MRIKDYLEEVGPCHWRIRKDYASFMRCDAHFFANEQLLEGFQKDKCLEQLVNVTALPGVLEPVYGMPDMHEGYGFPIGGVAAVDLNEGVISPGGIGYDINCGVRLLRTNLSFQEVQKRIGKLTEALFKSVPSGLKRDSGLKVDKKTFQRIMMRGAQAVVEMGYGDEKDIECTESAGCLSDADPKTVSQNAIERGFHQLGTIGSGNHFVEVQRVSKIFQPEIAEIFGLWKGQVVVLIHTGSRGFGHQIATDYIRLMLSHLDKWGIYLPDKQLACAPFRHELGQNYYQAMCCAANFAWANRQVITHKIRNVFENIFGNVQVEVCYDVAHNIAKIETHEYQGKPRAMLVHRKGATRAFPMNHPEVTEKYRSVGHPVLIPGSMGTSSYVLVGAVKNPCFGSTCHGAGRQLSRKKAAAEVNARELLKTLQSQGIHAMAGSLRGLAEEAPVAYKDVSVVVETVERAGIALRVAQMRPLAVIKG